MNILQQFEQMQAMLRDFAPVLMSYKQHLKKQGFTDDEAFALVRDYQRILFTRRDAEQ